MRYRPHNAVLVADACLIFSKSEASEIEREDAGLIVRVEVVNEDSIDDESDIIYCGGKYEVHPTNGGGWVVVNGETGNIRYETQYRETGRHGQPACKSQRWKCAEITALTLTITTQCRLRISISSQMRLLRSACVS
jgi:hypothetical protein